MLKSSALFDRAPDEGRNMPTNARLVKIGYGVAGLIAGGVLAATVSAQAATTSSPTTTTATTGTTAAADAHPGDNGADGVPEAQEHHGGGGLDKSGTITAVTGSSVTIKTSTGTTAYTTNAASDIDKNGEAEISSLIVGDPVTFSVDSTTTTLIDKLHTGNKAQNMPQAPTGTTAG